MLQEQLIISGKSPEALESFFHKLMESSTEFRKFGTTDNYVSAADQLKGSEYAENFNKDHMKYALEGIEQLDLLRDHPGPVHLAGIGLGATVALAISCMRSERVERCIAMAPLFEIHEFVPGSKLPYINSGAVR